jgi:S1-C subfamily serine protease
MIVRFAVISIFLSGCGCAPPETRFALPRPSGNGYRLVVQRENTKIAEVSCFPVTNDAVATCLHLVKDAVPQGLLLPNGERVATKQIIATNEENDLALVEVDATLTPAHFGSIAIPRGFRKGDRLITVSRFGTVPATADSYLGGPKLVLIIDVAGIDASASGGAVFDDKDEFVGLIQGMISLNQATVIRAYPLRDLLSDAGRSPRD